ncbi:hypothetical protein [Streptomyces triticiradicis]|uniref:Uncharacterized protein n=1 Tax=Streptomyces triticiradicis TaxID=2651189 RepID=A0A7J5D2K6_9ACTN|nr:hypothetical protein [Streptomyces triticiradicis]KAB1977760.1 hypothetical protein F8144_41125 [Streptomyces triticiradicis]
MPQPAPVRPRPILARGLAPRFALLIGDPRIASALRASCTDDIIEVAFPESLISCRLARLSSTVQLLCAFRVTHLAVDGSSEKCHRMDLALDGTLGTTAQCEAVLHRLHAFRCAATASRVRAATRVLEHENLPRGPFGHAYLAAA